MTVKELIAELLSHDQDKHVMILYADSEWNHYFEPMIIKEEAYHEVGRDPLQVVVIS